MNNAAISTHKKFGVINIETGEVEKHIIGLEANDDKKNTTFNGFYNQQFRSGIKFIMNLKLNGSERVVLDYLTLSIEKDTGKVDFSPSQMVKELGFSRQYFTKIKAKFIKLNLIYKSEGNTYINPNLFWRGDAEICAKTKQSKPFLRLVK